MIDVWDEDTPEGLRKKFFLIASVELAWRGGEDAKCMVQYFQEEKKMDGTLTGRIEFNPILNKTAQGWLQKCADIFCYVLNTSTYSGAQHLGPSNQSEAYFNGSSYIRLQTTISLKKPTGLSFRTCSGGILFSQQQNDDLIELSVGVEGLLFHAKTGGKQFDSKIPGNYINNKWYTVYLQYILGNLTLDIHGQSEVLANSTYHSELLTSPGLYNEGAAVLLIGKQFNGCILEGPSIVFQSTVISSNHNVLFEPCPIPSDSCIIKDPQPSNFCVTEPCMFGTCLNGLKDYSCACHPRYTGKNCEIDLGDPCEKAHQPCKNGGTCASDNQGHYACTCTPNYTGKVCDVDMSTQVLCQTKDCYNGGLCEVNLATGVADCLCEPGFVGNNCEINVDECLPSPCLNGGTCTDGFNNFTCDCSHTGYTGRMCELDINECLSVPCLNHGTCFNTYGGYMCQCLSGYKGKHCEHNINECTSHPCFNNGECVDSKGSYACKCLPGFIGDHCEIEQHASQCDPTTCPPYADCVVIGNTLACKCKPENPGDFPNCNIDSVCVNNPCKNGGVCSSHMGGFNCSCLPGYAGPACERVESCACLNGGKCVPEAVGIARQCICPEGWAGYDCGRRAICADDPCEHMLSCQDYPGGFYCSCEPGWTGLNCNVELAICSTSSCLNGGTCYDTGECECAPGFEGKVCQINVDECASMPCLNGGKCTDLVNGFYCNCTDDWMGEICEAPFDACKLKLCQNNATCMTNPQNKREYSCTCANGFEGERCEINIDDCVGAVCAPGKVCYDLIDDYECRCPPGYAGDNCSVDLDPCAKEPCSNIATCEVDKATHEFRCICPPGYKGRTCKTDIDECQLADNICNQGICVNNIGSFQCYCMPGYTGERCDLDFDECLSMPCQNNATCHNKINNYECDCPPGYKGKDCSININECEPMPCRNGATCIDGINDFKCVCQQGLTGKLCQTNIDDCESSPCQHGALCIDGLNSYTCNCSDTGYEGVHCETNIDDCSGNPCQNGAACVDKVKDYECSCFNGYNGKNCEIDIDECEVNPCKYDGVCLEKSNASLYLPTSAQLNLVLPEVFNKTFDYGDAAGYICDCVPGVVGENCQINIDECQSSPCFQGLCIDKIGGFVCECDEGFEGDRCDVDIDECEKYKPCINGKCVDKKASYFCDCDPKFGGKNCSVELTGCMEKPCLNEAVCKPYLINETEHKFNCSCLPGYHGSKCEQQTTMSLSGNSLVVVNTTRDEGYDIQFRFKTTLGDGLLALGKGLTYYILELSKGRLNLHSSLLNKWEGVFIGSNLNNSEWQRVFVAINSTHLVLSANDEQTIYPISFNENYNVSSTSFPLTYIGGIPSNLRKLTHGQPFLVGCTEDVLINGEWVLPQDRNASWLNFHNVDVGCTRKPQCDPNPCRSGGHCTDRWRDFSCTCERPYLGHICQYNYTAATFGYENITDSMVTVDVYDSSRRAVRTIVDISMFIRTRQSKGHVFYLGSTLSPSNSLDETYIAAQLDGGELLVSIYFNGSQESYTVGGVKLDNGFNHLIEVIRNVTLVQVKLNGTEYFRKTISATGTLDAQVLYLGGQPQLRPVRQAMDNAVTTKIDLTAPTAPAAVTASLSNINFKGIIQDVQISNGSTTMIVEFYPLKADDLEIPTPFGVVSFDKTTVLEGIHSDDSCKINPCQRNGECINTWNDYRCQCVRGFKGKDCTELEFCELEGCPHGAECKNLEDGYECVANATFNGKSDPLQYGFSTLPNSSKSINFDKLELTYRTRSWGTVLFAKLKDNYFVIFIYHNEVIVEWSFNGIVETRRFRKDRFVGQWLTLYFTYKDSVLRGGFKDNVMDEAPNFEVNDFDFIAFTEIFMNGSIYIAGSDNKKFDYLSAINNTDSNMTGYIPETDTTTAVSLTSNSLEVGDSHTEDVALHKVDQNKQTDRFKGCLSEIRIGGLLLPFFTTKEQYPRNQYSKEFFELLPDTHADIGCVLCYDDDCFNQGYCINPTETYKCNCTEGYTADDCSIDINECENNQCQNNATCRDLIAKYECICQDGYEGNYCEAEIDECLSNPCRHGGRCENLIGNFKCYCPEDFIGKQCEAPLLVTCDNKPCFEGATCETGPNEKTGNNFTCFCTEGMEGSLCDTPFCLRKHCENGHCNTTGAVPYCQCLMGFEGHYCETNIDECVLSTGESPCQHGGQCIDKIAGYECNCTGTGYTGLLCENDVDECQKFQDPCGRAGRCENLPGSYRCTCEIKGKCGHHCNIDDPCEAYHPCIHGDCHSQCVDNPDYFCQCHENYTGKNCTDLKIAASKSDGGVNILYIVVPILLIVLIGVAIGMAVLVNIARSKRATRGTYSPSAQEFCNPRVELDHVLKPPPEERLI